MNDDDEGPPSWASTTAQLANLDDEPHFRLCEEMSFMGLNPMRWGPSRFRKQRPQPLYPSNTLGSFRDLNARKRKP